MTGVAILQLDTPLTAPESAQRTDDVRLAAAGDVRAFERVYREHLPRVHALVRRMTAGAT